MLSVRSKVGAVHVSQRRSKDRMAEEFERGSENQIEDKC